MRRLFCVAVALIAGCQGGIYFTDDEAGPSSSGSLFAPRHDAVSLPYALGTRVVLTAHETPQDLAGWSFVSDTPDIFAVAPLPLDSSGVLQATGHALAEGEARLRLLDAHGNERHAVQVQVRAADSAQLFAHGDLRVLGDEAEAQYQTAQVTDARVLAGGKAVFGVAYFHAGQRVYGHGLAEVPAVADLAVETHTSGSAPVTEWLFVTPAAPGAYTLAVTQAGTTLATLPITAVADGEVIGLSIAAEPTAKKHDGDAVWLLARARGSDGREVLGVYADWTLDGVAQAGDDDKPKSGDLYRYEYAKGGPLRTVAATHGALAADIAVPARKGYVSDTTYLGCAAAPGRPAGGAPWLPALGLVGVAGWRRARALKGRARA